MRKSRRLRALLMALLSVSLVACGGADSDSGTKTSSAVKLVQNATASGLPTVVEFGAASCASCREMKVVLDSVAQGTKGRAHVLIIDISKDWDVARTFRIQMMPTQVFFAADGREVWRHLGKLPESEVIARLGVAPRP